MSESEVKVLKRGDIQTDPDGTEWWISSVSFNNGKPLYSRIQIGSYAYYILVAEGVIKEDTESG